MNCNNSQNIAISHKDGPALVLAGPGSGKTFVITNRIHKLITEYGVEPSNILVVTFTRAAANQMKERFLKSIGKERSYVSFGTFHSVFFTIIKHAYNYNVNNILSDEEKYEIIKKLLDYNKVELEDENEIIGRIISEISIVKGDGINVDKFYSKCLQEETFRSIFSDYNRMLIQREKIDFDDMLLMCYDLLANRKDILSMWQNKYRYILIDEFQDINRIQYETIKLLAKPENNIFVVGDDDQSIYSFRGAKPELMKMFEKDYPGAKRVILNINYRSTDSIINRAIKLIGNNRNRFHKEISGTKGLGSAVSILEYEDTYKENEAIVESISKYISMGGDYKDIAILYRTNVTPRALLEKIMEYNIPFVAKDVIPNIYEHFIFRHMRAYIDISLGSNKRSDYLEIINKPKRYVSRDCLDKSEMSIERIRVYYEEKPWVLGRLDRLEEDLLLLRDMSPFSAINYIRRGIGYDDYIREYAKNHKINEEDLFDILVQLQESARDYNTYDEWFEHIAKCTRLLKSEIENVGEKKDCITFSTMHSAKGLEYDVVYIIDANEGITPHHKSVSPEEIEEERRMFYVAMTRARKSLNISYTRERYNKKTVPSRFVEEIL